MEGFLICLLFTYFLIAYLCWNWNYEKENEAELWMKFTESLIKRKGRGIDIYH